MPRLKNRPPRSRKLLFLRGLKLFDDDYRYVYAEKAMGVSKNNCLSPFFYLFFIFLLIFLFFKNFFVFIYIYNIVFFYIFLTNF